MKEKKTKEYYIQKAKGVGALVCDVGAQALSCGVLRAILPPGVNAIAKGGICLGGVLLGGFLGEQMSGYLDRQIDSTAEDIQEMVETVKKDIDIITDKDLEKKSEENEDNKTENKEE